jgi:hypothetical protein
VDNLAFVVPFSPDSQDKLMNLLAGTVRQTTVSSIQKAKCYSIIFDTTPDNAHIEQISQSDRFVEIQRDSVEIKGAFIDFIPLDLKPMYAFFQHNETGQIISAF